MPYNYVLQRWRVAPTARYSVKRRSPDLETTTKLSKTTKKFTLFFVAFVFFVVP